jgi:hypothetical protein
VWPLTLDLCLQVVTGRFPASKFVAECAVPKTFGSDPKPVNELCNGFEEIEYDVSCRNRSRVLPP